MLTRYALRLKSSPSSSSTSINHSSTIQFRSSVKFRLKVVVLNQLTAIAARGIRRETVTEEKYHRSFADDSVGRSRHMDLSIQRSNKPVVTSKNDPATKSTQISVP